MGEGRHLSFLTWKSRGHIEIRPGWGVNTTGDVDIEIHSLFTKEPQPSLSGVQPHCCQAEPVAVAAGLGRAAAGAGRALRAADAVGRAAVLRGRRRGGHLLPSCSLPCVGVDVPQGPR